MKKFQFRLQKVLDAKESEEKLAQKELGLALQVLKTEEDKLNELHVEVEHQIARQRSMQNKTLKAADFILSDRWSRHLKKQVRRQKEAVQIQQEVVEKKRKQLLEISREKKVLEKLREKKLEEHTTELKSYLQNQLDDIGARQRNQAQ